MRVIQVSQGCYLTVATRGRITVFFRKEVAACQSLGRVAMEARGDVDFGAGGMHLTKKAQPKQLINPMLYELACE